MAEAVGMQDITKHFAGVVANDHVSFSAEVGEVHALLGENGAGKSTLMSILAGLYRPDSGSLRINGQPVHLHAPGDAIRQGIGMVYQHFMLVPSLTVTENVMLGQPGGLRLTTRAVADELAELSRRYGLQIEPQARIWQLSVGEQQRVEILRLLQRGARIVIFDEPTAVLTPQEAQELIRTLRQMAASGFTVIFISHKLDEVLAVADRITVLRRGRVVTTLEARTADRATLAQLMVGREVNFEHERTVQPPGPVVLELDQVTVQGDRGRPALHRLSLAVRAGEILGIAGVAGNGQRELAEVVTGLRRATAGRVLIEGVDRTNQGPQALVRAGVAHVPEDRAGTGLIPTLDLTDNVLLKEYRRPPLARGLRLEGRAVRAFAERLLRDYQVDAPGPATKARLLSGGNQQKLLLARELSGAPRLLVAVHPTRGVDIGATEAIHQLLLAQRARGAAVLLIGEDLDELLGLADRVAVLYEGRIMGTVPAATADIAQLGLMMAGQAATA